MGHVTASRTRGCCCRGRSGRPIGPLRPADWAASKIPESDRICRTHTASFRRLLWQCPACGRGGCTMQDAEVALALFGDADRITQVGLRPSREADCQWEYRAVLLCTLPALPLLPSPLTEGPSNFEGPKPSTVETNPGPASVGLGGPGGGRPTWHFRARCVTGVLAQHSSKVGSTVST